MPIHVVAKSRISFLHDWITFHYIYTYTVISLSIHLSWTLRMFPLSWLLWLMLQWTLRCRYLFKLLFFFSSDKYCEVESPHDMVVIFLIFWVTSILFSTMANQFKFPSTGHTGSLFFTSSPILQFSRSVVSGSLRPLWLQHARLPCPSPTLGACSNSRPSSRCVVPFSSCLQAFPVSGSFPVSEFFASGGRSIGHHQRLIVVLLMIAVLRSGWWHLLVMLICFSLVIGRWENWRFGGAE